MENNNISELWVDKHRPKNLNEYVLNSSLKQFFKEMVKNKSLQNFTLAGIQGSGKTSLAKILCDEFNAEVLFVPCATDGTLDVLRTKIQDFCNAMSFDGKLKIVLLDELDSSSSQGVNSFQLGLRTMIEAAQDDCRFICTCNYSAKIIPAVLSRCPIIPLKFDKKDLLVRVKDILDAEHIEYSRESLKDFIEEAFQYYPDCRRIINYLQLCCNSGKLVVNLSKVANIDKKQFVEDIVGVLKTEDNLLTVRKFYMQNKDKINDYVEAGSDLFNYVIDKNVIDTCDGILKLTDLLFQLNQVIDKEAGFYGMVVAVKKFMKNNVIGG